jgi:hypothetical protein
MVIDNSMEMRGRTEEGLDGPGHLGRPLKYQQLVSVRLGLEVTTPTGNFSLSLLLILYDFNSLKRLYQSDLGGPQLITLCTFLLML